MSAIKAIETQYAGCRFRSRLEARWAVFFDALNIVWQYEPQGFDLASGYYLPDFWLPTVQGGIWYEVKGVWGDEEGILKCVDLAKESGSTVALAAGDVPRNNQTPESQSLMAFLYPDGSFDMPMKWCLGPMSGKVGIEFDGLSARIDGISYDNGCVFPDSPRLIRAYESARSARFEHGEVA